ncbi:YadA-like family protein, partial [Streptobacillus moniliformis]|uniref:YadA-like family protein n=1 Tax=Streptobacillus moniliformis TaxID=34105 RepID=UPI000A790A59
EAGIGIGSQVYSGNGDTHFTGPEFAHIGKLSLGVKIKEKYNVALYTGYEKGALGISGLNEKSNLVYRASGSLNTKGHISLGAGLGYQFDNLEARIIDILTLQSNVNINMLDE